jgi:hypothetical protein
LYIDTDKLSMVTTGTIATIVVTRDTIVAPPL